MANIETKNKYIETKYEVLVFRKCFQIKIAQTIQFIMFIDVFIYQY